MHTGPYHRPADVGPSRRRPLRLGLLVLVVALLSAGAVEESGTLAPRLKQIIDSQQAQQAFWGIYVQDLESGDVLHQFNADKALIPASNQKVLTSATALDALGGDYRYQTTLYFDGEIDGGVLRGDLVLRGSGDPTFGSVEVGGADPLRDWARRLAEMGVRRIDGRIIGDDDAFDDRPYAEGWDVDYLTTQSSRSLGVSAGGLSYGDNVVQIKIEASRPGSAPRITLTPTDYLNVRNDLTTSSRRRGISVTTERRIGVEGVHLAGSIPRSYAGTIVMPVGNATLFTAHSFKRHLERAGVEVAADVHDVDDLDERPSYDAARPVFVHLSPRLAEILKIVNKESNNFYAEQVFRTFAANGSAEAAGRRVKALLARAGASTDDASIRDGSGLSRKDMVTPEAMGRLLAHMHGSEHREAFLASLAAGGEPSTTLRYRLSRVPVRAKTGSLEYVRALSGYATDGQGRAIAFAIFANNYTAPSYRITQTIDRIVMELAGSS